ncbi:sulfotransferase domain-containing protein [Schleiferiaceae bacterium]|nr:sulfotransferase domain-containing protein [Schleiferiaceae bacterium]
MKIKKSPNLYIIGQPKAGSTTLMDILSASEYFTCGKIKEPRFWIKSKLEAYPSDPLQFIYNNSPRTYEEYVDSYGAARYVVDGSVQYLYHIDDIINDITAVRDVKLIVLLRNPVNRAISHFKFLYPYLNLSFKEYFENNYDVNGELSDFWDILGHGLISDKLGLLMNNDKVSTHVIIFEDLIKNQKEEINKLAEWLNIEINVDLSLDRRSNRTVNFVVPLAILRFWEKLKKYLPWVYSPLILGYLRKVLMIKDYDNIITADDVEFLENFFHEEKECLRALTQRDDIWH